MNIGKDRLWKTALRLRMQHTVAFFFPNEYPEVDWSKGIVFLDKELNTINLHARPKNRIADVLVLLTLKNGKKRVIFLHIEVQGYSDSDFALRIHQIRYRIEDLTGENPVMLAIFTDDDPNFHPREYYVETWGASNRTIFHTYKVMEHPPKTYADPNNPIALMMEIVYNSTQLTKASDEEIMDSFLVLFKKLVASGYPKEYIILLKSFIEAHIILGNDKNYRIFDLKMEKMVKYETTADILEWLYVDKVKARLEKEQKENARLVKAKARVESEKARVESEKARVESEKARVESEKARLRERSVMTLLGQAMAKEAIAAALEITMEDIHAIEAKYKDGNPFSTYLNGKSKN